MTIDVCPYARQCSSTAVHTGLSSITQQTLRRCFSAGDRKVGDCQHDRDIGEWIKVDFDEQKGNLFSAEFDTDEEERPTESLCSNVDERFTECPSAGHQTDNVERDGNEHEEEAEDKELVEETRSQIKRDRKLTKTRFCSYTRMFV